MTNKKQSTTGNGAKKAVAKKQAATSKPARKQAKNNQSDEYKKALRKKKIKLFGIELSYTWLHTSEMKARFGFTPGTLRNWVLRGLLHPSKPGRDNFYNEAEVQAMMIMHMIPKKK